MTERLLTGDTPTGRLHLGHWVGSLEQRVASQDRYECYFIIANLHALTTHPENTDTIKENSLAIALDYLAAGIDPAKSNIFLQSEIPAIAELTYLLSMLVPFSRVMRNPTLKEELQIKQLKDQYSFGFVLYPVGQVADILAFRPSSVPVGADQLPHIEMTNEIARRFNQLYSTTDEDKVFPTIETKTTQAKRLVGIGPPNADGTLFKMSKSLNNAIYLSDSPEIIAEKVKRMYTDPNRIRATDPGRIENNPLWNLHESLNPDKAWVETTKNLYRAGRIGDVQCKQKLIDVIVRLTEPMRKRRAFYEQRPQLVLEALKKGTQQAAQVAQETLLRVKRSMNLDWLA